MKPSSSERRQPLDCLQLRSCNEQNAYLTATCQERINVEAGPESGSNRGAIVIVKKILYGLKSSRVYFHAHLAETWLDIKSRPWCMDQTNQKIHGTISGRTQLSHLLCKWIHCLNYCSLMSWWIKAQDSNVLYANWRSDNCVICTDGWSKIRSIQHTLNQYQIPADSQHEP